MSSESLCTRLINANLLVIVYLACYNITMFGILPWGLVSNVTYIIPLIICRHSLSDNLFIRKWVMWEFCLPSTVNYLQRFSSPAENVFTQYTGKQKKLFNFNFVLNKISRFSPLKFSWKTLYFLKIHFYNIFFRVSGSWNLFPFYFLLEFVLFWSKYWCKCKDTLIFSLIYLFARNLHTLLSNIATRTLGLMLCVNRILL